MLLEIQVPDEAVTLAATEYGWTPESLVAPAEVLAARFLADIKAACQLTLERVKLASARDEAAAEASQLFQEEAP